MHSKFIPGTLAVAISTLCFGTVWAAGDLLGKTQLTKGTPTTKPIDGRLLKVAEPRKSEPPYRFIANGEFRAMMDTDKRQAGLGGRVSLYLQADPSMLKSGLVEVRDINIVYGDLPDGTLGDQVESGGGGLGFAVDRAKGVQTLSYDPKSGAITGSILGHMDFSWLNRFATPEQDERVDSYETPRQTATLAVSVQLEKPFDLTSADNDVAKAPAKVRMSLEADRMPGFDIPSYRIFQEEVQLVFEFTRFHNLRVLKELCLQPVRIGWFTFNWNGWVPSITPDYSGAGLAFGLPGAETEWRKADIVFDVQDWMTVWDPGFRVVSADNSGFLTQEESDLIDTVDEAGCIEMFFIEAFDPQGTHGGGATVGSGTSSSKIISSDNNAVFGIDLTHLAHELGHVVGLGHPNNPGSLVAGSTGSLLCPSGFMNDNPQVNSQDNEDNASNPLFLFRFGFNSSVPDCQNDADCGAC